VSKKTSPDKDLAPEHHDLMKVVETMNCGLVASDLDGIVVFANKRLLGWLGYARSDVVGEPSLNLVIPEHFGMLLAEGKAIREGDLRARLVVLRRKDATTFPALLIPQRFFDDEGVLAATFSILVDLGTVQTAKRVGVEPNPAEVVPALEEIAHRLRTISGLPAEELRPVNLGHPALDDLSPREKEVLHHLILGDRVANIAEQLFISEHTVRNHLKSIYRKTGVNSQADVIKWTRSLS
jgi:PAS domain S-box-containing protein